MHHKCTSFLQHCLQHNQSPIPIHLPNSMISISSSQSIIHRDISNVISNHIQSPILQDYIQQKFHLSDSAFALIDWDAHEIAFTSHPFHKQVTLSKMIFEWQHTGQQQEKISKYNRSTCPNCNLPETSDHVFQCTATSILDSKHRSITKFLTKMQSIQTAPPISSFIHQYYIPWLYDYSHLQPSFPGDIHPNSNINTSQQHQIGINHLPKGHIC